MVAIWPDGSICGYCYQAAKRITGICACGHQGVLPGLIDDRPACRRCSGVKLNVDCVSCGDEAELYSGGRCQRCVLGATGHFERLASFCRLIMFDKRGTGLSDRVAVATLEERMDDLRAVMDEAGSQRAAVFGSSEGGALSVLFTTTYPERVSALVLYGAYPRMAWAPDYPDGVPEEMFAYGLRHLEENWGHGLEGGLPLWALTPDRVDDPAWRKAHGRWERLSASPGAAVAIQQMIRQMDVRHLLSAIRVPTLVVHRTADLTHAVGSRYMAAHIPGAKVVELPGSDYFPYLGDQDAILDEIEEFLTGVRPVPVPDRALATVLFTDIVSSTQRAATLGDDAWTGRWTATMP